MRHVKTAALTVLSVVIIVFALFAMFSLRIVCNKNQEQEPIHDTIYMYRELSEWEIFTMATMKVESGYDPMAINVESGARGILQIMPIYVAEYNRLTGNNYNHDAAFDPISSLFMWEYINEYYNATRDFEKAVYIHNPKAGDWYRNRVFNAMDDIERYEAMRRNVIEICYDR